MEDTDGNKLQDEESLTAIMKPLPSDEGALLEEATSLGLNGPNRSLEQPRAKLLDCINSSKNIGRCINHVSIVLLGNSGVGKSATVNHLLGVELSKTSKTESETRSTQEFVVYGRNPKYGVEKLPLGLVDTPGSCDTDGLKQDACNFLSIKRFFREHPTLSGCYPNLIFILLKAVDNRTKGENSSLRKSLRCIKQLSLVDTKNPNVVVILTHVCSIRKKNDTEWTKELGEIKSTVSKIVFDHLKVLAPVVLIENTYDDCNLEKRGDYTVLQNQELQPKNLYMACAKILVTNDDNLGLIALNSIFAELKKDEDRCIKPGHHCEAKNAKNCTLDSEEKNFFELFERAAKGGLEDPVYSVTLQYATEQELEGEQLEEVLEIARVLKNLAKGNPPNFGSHSLPTVEFFLGKEISSTGQRMLQEKFNIEINPSRIVLESGRLIGQGYNIFTDKAVAAQVMNLASTNKYGIAIPTCAKFEKVQETKSFMEVLDNDQSYAQSRLKSLNVNLTVKPGIFKMDCRAGYNKNSTSSSSTSEYSYLFEQRLFELKIGNYKQLQNRGMEFTEDFESDVEELPDWYDGSDSSCVSKFQRFFDRFGHFLVSAAYGGGSVEVKCSKEAVESTKISLAEAKAYLAATLEGLEVVQAGSSADASAVDNSQSKSLLQRSTYSWVGGDVSLQTNESIGDKERLKKWKTSLILNPMMLSSELTLEPISTAVGCVNTNKKQATYDALKNLLSSEIEIPEKKKKKGIRSYWKAFMKRIKNAFTREQTIIEPNQAA